MSELTKQSSYTYEREKALSGNHDEHLQDPSRELLRILADGVSDAVFMLDPAGNILTWNSGAARMTQFASEEIVGRYFSVFYTPEQLQAGEPQRALEAAAGDGAFQEENWHVRKDRTLFRAGLTISAIRNPEGSLIGYSNFMRDVSSLYAAHEAIARSDARFSGIVKISEDAIISMDEQQTITLFNDGAERYSGIRATKWSGRRSVR